MNIPFNVDYKQLLLQLPNTLMDHLQISLLILSELINYYSP